MLVYHIVIQSKEPQRERFSSITESKFKKLKFWSLELMSEDYVVVTITAQKTIWEALCFIQPPKPVFSTKNLQHLS